MARQKMDNISLIIAILIGLISVKTVYAYYNLTAFWKQPSAATGYKLAFTTASQTTTTTWACSTAVNIQTQYSDGSALTVSSPTTVSLSYTAGSGLFYSDSGCTTQVTSFTISSGSTSGTVYFKLGKIGTNTIQASASGYTSATQDQTATNLIAYTWLGSSSNNFGTASNWSNGSGGTHTTAPSSTTNVYFDNNCNSSYCSPTVAANISVKGLYMMPTYTGTISVGSYTLTVASSGAFSVGGGTITQGSGNWSINSTATTTIYGGAVNGGSGTIACGTYTQTGGTVTLSSSSSTNTFTPSSTVMLSGGSLIGGAGLITFSSTSATNIIQGGTLTVGAGGLTISGNLTMTSGTLNGGAGALSIAKIVTLSGGNFNGAAGDITLSSTSATFTVSGGTFVGGTGKLFIYKNISQTAGSFSAPSGLTSVSGTMTISGGTFNGASGTIQAVSTVTLSGGTITAPSNTWTMQNALTVSGTPTFSHNSGTVVFAQSSGSSTLKPGSLSFYNVTFASTGVTYTLTGTMNVYGAFVIGDSTGGTVNTGTINVYGPSLTANQSYYAGTATIVAAGNASGQTITGATGAFPNLTINAGSNNVTLSGTVPVQRHFTYTSAGTFTTTGSNLYLHNFSAASNTPIYIPGSVTYNNVTIESLDDTVTVSGTMNVAGNLYVGDQSNAGSSVINKGTLSVAGNVIIQNYGYVSGTAVIKVVGQSGTPSVISTSGGNNPFIPYITVEAGTHDVTVSGTVGVVAGWTMTSVGSFAATSSTLNVGVGHYGWSVAFAAGNVNYGNVTIDISATTTDLGGANASIYGDFNIIASYSPELNNGTLNCYGSIIKAQSINDATGYTYVMGTAIMIARGNYLGGIQTISSELNNVSGRSSLTNLSINAPSKDIVLGTNLYVAGNFTVTSFGTFVANTSTLEIEGEYNLSTDFWPHASARYNNVTFFGCHSGFNLNNETFNVDGDLFFHDYCGGGQPMINGTIYVKGNMGSLDGCPDSDPSLIIHLIGNAGGSTLELAGGTPDITISTGTYPVIVSGTNKAGSWQYLNSGTFVTSGSTVVITANSFKPGSVTYDSLKFFGYNPTVEMYGQTALVATSIILADQAGTLNINNGTLEAKGSVTIDTSVIGTALLKLTGISPSIWLTGNNELRINTNLEISGTAILQTADLNFGTGYGMAVNFNIISGSLDMNGHDITVGQIAMSNTSALNLSSGTSITRNAGTLAVQGVTIGAGPYSSGTIY